MNSEITQMHSEILYSNALRDNSNELKSDLHNYAQMNSEHESHKFDNLKSEPDRSSRRRSENLIATDITACHEEQLT